MKKTFNVVSGAMVCSDPCYEIPTFCQGIITNVKNGEWEADIEMSYEGSWGDRVAVLKVRHITANFGNCQWDLMDFRAGVDSGQFGFFDKDFYRNDEAANDLPKYVFDGDYDREPGDQWYRAACKLTLDDEQWGVMPNGAVSSSGYGDGSYNVYGCKDNNGEYVAFYVEFISGSDDEDEFDDEDEY